MSATYNELLANVPNDLLASTTDVAANLPRLVRMAHEDLLKIIDHDLFRGSGAITVTPPAKTFSLSAGLDVGSGLQRVLEVRSVTAADAAREWALTRMHADAASTLYPQLAPAQTKVYAERGAWNSFQLFPAPDETLTLTIEANVEPVTISPSVQTNILTIEASRAMEAAVHYRAAVYIGSQRLVDRYLDERNTAVGLVNAGIARRRRDERATRGRDTANAAGT